MMPVRRRVTGWVTPRGLGAFAKRDFESGIVSQLWPVKANDWIWRGSLHRLSETAAMCSGCCLGQVLLEVGSGWLTARLERRRDQRPTAGKPAA